MCFSQAKCTFYLYEIQVSIYPVDYVSFLQMVEWLNVLLQVVLFIVILCMWTRLLAPRIFNRIL